MPSIVTGFKGGTEAFLLAIQGIINIVSGHVF